MVRAFLWGALATSSLLLGGWLACRFSIGRRALGLLMAFGAGTLFAAVAFELVFEAVMRSRGSGVPALGFLAGALCFQLGDWLIGRLGRRDARQRRRRQTALPAGPAGSDGAGAGLAVPMVLGIVLDGVPESLVIGLGLLETQAISVAMLVAILLSNLPEAVAGTVGMKAGGWSSRSILLLWLVIALVCAGSSALGYAMFSGAPKAWLSLIQAFAGGAILLMLSNSMIPESHEQAGKLAGIFTVLGFFISVTIMVHEAGRVAIAHGP
jgi:ZIP family zinc transporter